MALKNRMIIILSVTVVIAAGESRASPALAPSDPCSPVTQTEVSAVVGVTVGPGEKITPKACQWMWTNNTTSTVRVTLQFLDAQDLGDMRAGLPGIKKTPISGLGDDAVYTTVGTLTTLSVKKQSVGFVVRLYGVPGQPKQMAMEKTLATKVLAKL